MFSNDNDITDKIRKQFNFGPYPRVSLDESPKDQLEVLLAHNFTTPFYLRYRQFKPTQEAIILDAGCGTGYKALALAYANPGAKIVGIDLSEKSIELARTRIEHYQLKNIEFHVLSLYDLPQLNQKFDFINCDEVLYLIPDIIQGLNAMKAVLKPKGIIRANLHSLYKRMPMLMGQKLFQQMGIMEVDSETMQMEIVVEVFKALKDNILLKRNSWNPQFEQKDSHPEILSNHLLLGDRGFTVPDLFNALKAANLEFIQMTNWRQWQLENLFKEPNNLPIFLALSLPEATLEEKLTLFELFHPLSRLLDFWCGHPIDIQPPLPVSEWTNQDWFEATIHLHPVLHSDKVKQAYQQASQKRQTLPLSNLMPIPGIEGVSLDITLAACLLPALWDSPQTLANLIQRWQILRPIDLATLTPTTPETAFNLVQNTLTGLENFGYIFLDRSAT